MSPASEPPNDLEHTADLSGQDQATGPDARILAPGTILGDYKIVEVLGRGAMGIVYKSRHRTLDRLAALKVLKTGTDPDSAPDIKRFLREARSTARLDHHNIVTVHNAGEADGLLFIEMQLVDGEPLSDKIGSGPIDPWDATRYVEQIAHALQHAHSRQIIHRDIKPGNVLVSPDGVVKVVDFGMAKPTVVDVDAALTAPGTVLGTPYYMAPEQWEGEPADTRTDLYAVGATYFHLVTGRPPFQGKLSDLVRQHMDTPVPVPHEINPDVPQAVSRVICRLMAKDPDQRYDSAAELIADLRKLQAVSPGPKPTGDADQTTVFAGAGTAPIDRIATEDRVATVRDTPPPAPAGPTGPPPPAPEPPLAAVRASWRGTFLLAAILVGAVIGAEALGWWQRLELVTLDLRFAWRGPTPATDRVALLVVDDDTAKAIGWPFDRDALVDVIDALHTAGASAVALDLLILDRGPGAGDANLAQASADADRLVHAMFLFRGERQSPDLGPETVSDTFAVSVAGQGLPEVNRAAVPLEAIVHQTKYLGNVGLLVDPDGLVRRVPLLVKFRGNVYPSLSLMAVCRALGATQQHVTWSPGQPLVISPPGGDPISVPVDRTGAMLISVRGTCADRTQHSFREVLEQAQAGTDEAKRDLARRFAGKVVLVGTVLSGQADIHPMPGMGAAPLVTAHAMAIETLLARDFVTEPGWGTTLLIVAGLTFGAVVAGERLPWVWAFVLIPVVMVGYWIAACAVLEGSGAAWAMVAPTVGLLAGGLGGRTRRSWVEHRQRQLLADALGRYLPRKVSRQILSDPKALRLGGQRKELSLLCVSIHHFGALSERLEPEEVGQLLHPFFAVVADVVIRHGGTIDRFDGEGARAFFGDPVPQQDHAQRAVRCALELRTRVRQVVRQWASLGRPEPTVGIGVHTGYVTVGNVGSVQRMEYTVLGGNLEIAEQLSAAATHTVLVSARTKGITASDVIYEPRVPSDDHPLSTDAFEACALR